MAQSVIAINMTAFFKREIKMYALGDIKLKNPIAIKQILYIFMFLAIWAGPILLAFGIILELWYAAIVLGPPIALGIYANRPVWMGKTFFDFAKTTAMFVSEPKVWADLKDSKPDETYVMNSEIWVSRRRELQLLADVLEGKDSFDTLKSEEIINV